MGLDTIELVMEIEKEFDLRITDEDAERIWTVGSLIEYVAQRKALATQRSCPTARAFYRLRRMLVSGFGVDRRSVDPNIRFVELVPSDHHSRLRAELAVMGLRAMPSFAHERESFAGAVGLIAGIAVIASFLALFGVRASLSAQVAGPTILALIIIATYVALATRLFGGVLPRRLTLREAAFALSADEQVCAVRDQRTLHDIRGRVRRIVADQFGVPVEEVRDATRFVEDLGA